MPSLNVFNNDVAQASLAPPASVPERYAELWWYSGAVSSVSIGTAGSVMLQKGSTGTLSTGGTPSNWSQVKLYTLNASWQSSVKFAFEASMYAQSTYTSYAELWDITSNVAVASSQISTTSTTATVLRSGQFTLTPGHTYGVTIWSSNGTVYITDASLIIFS